MLISIFSILLSYYIGKSYLKFHYLPILFVPLVFLGANHIYPHMSYDTLSSVCIMFSMATSIYSEQKSRNKGYGYFILSGFFSVIPILAKQNIGITYFLTFFISYLVITTFRIQETRRRYIFINILLGIILATLCWLLFFQFTSGLENFFYGMITLAKGRLNISHFLNQVKQDFFSFPFIFSLLIFSLSNFVMARMKNIGQTKQEVIKSLGFSFPFIYLIMASRWDLLWVYLSFLSILFWLKKLFVIVRRRDWKCIDIQFFIPLIIVAISYSASLSQGFYGSTYSLWPFLIILLIFTLGYIYLKVLSHNNVFYSTSCILISVILTIFGSNYLINNTRLAFADLSSPTFIKTGYLKGFSMHIEHLKSFNLIIQFLENETDVRDGIVSIPGEDPIFSYLARKPLFPVLLFDSTVNPFSSDEIVNMIHKKKIKWILYKKKLQLNHRVSSIDKNLLSSLKEYELYKTVGFYDIFKRK